MSKCRVVFQVLIKICSISLFFHSTVVNGQIYRALDAHVDFVSSAPLEIIKASSESMQGLIDISSKRFAFKIYVKSFEGFNSNLQKIHFNENYLESNEYPISTFSGKIVEEILQSKGNYRAKGILEIHGIKREVIIPVDLDISNNEIIVESNFKVRLEDYAITIPKLVYQKIAEEIQVTVTGLLIRRE